MNDQLAPIRPGQVLAVFLADYQLSQRKLAEHLHIGPRRINEIILGKRSITADTARRLALFFGNTAEFWLNLQSHYELQQSIFTNPSINITPRSQAS